MNFIIYIFFIKITLRYSYLTNAHYHTSIKLDNGNFIIFSCDGQFTLDPTFRILYNSSTSVSGSDSYDIVKQFSKDDEGYILYRTNSYHYILDSYGKLIDKKSISDNKYNNVYSVVPYNHTRDKIYYYLIFYNSPNINFKKYSYNFTNKNYLEENLYFGSYDIQSLITCQLMKYLNEKVISCFFLKYLNNKYYLNCTVFELEKKLEAILTSEIAIEATSIYRLGSEVIPNNERKKALIILSITYQNIICLFYVGYDIHINNFTSYGYLIKNSCTLYSEYDYYFSISYFKETEEFIVSALNQCTFNKTTQYEYLIYSFDNNFKLSFFGIMGDLVLGDTCCKTKAFNIVSNNLHSIFLSSVAYKYCIILNLNTTKIMSSFILNKSSYS